MKDEQQSGLPNNPGSGPEGSKGTGSRDVRWTPGPWRCKVRGSGGMTSCAIIGDKPNPVFAVMMNTQTGETRDMSDPPDKPDYLFWSNGAYAGRTPETDIANSTLAAAAPELYEALEDVERMFTSFPLLAGSNSGKLSRIRAVLAKARGEL